MRAGRLLSRRVTVTVNGRRNRALFNSEPQTAFSPRLGATWEAVDGATLHTSWSRSFTPQFGTRIVADVVDGAPVLAGAPPERGRNVEGGVKLALPAARLTGIVSAYRLRRFNVLAADPDFPMYSRVSGAQRSRGIEAEAQWNPAPAFAINLAYSRIRARYVDDEFAPPGTPLPNILRDNFAAYARYVVPPGPLANLGVSAAVHYASTRFVYDAFTVAGADPLLRLPRDALGLSYRRKGWGLLLNVNNVADKRFFPDACCETRVTPGQPRNWRLTVNRPF